MLVEIFMYILTQIVGIFRYVFPGSEQLPIQLPWGLDGYVTSGVTGFKILAQSFPPFNDILTAFVIYLVFRIVIKLMKMIPLFGKSLSNS